MHPERTHVSRTSRARPERQPSAPYARWNTYSASVCTLAVTAADGGRAARGVLTSPELGRPARLTQARGCGTCTGRSMCGVTEASDVMDGARRHTLGHQHLPNRGECYAGAACVIHHDDRTGKVGQRRQPQCQRRQPDTLHLVPGRETLGLWRLHISTIEGGWSVNTPTGLPSGPAHRRALAVRVHLRPRTSQKEEWPAVYASRKTGSSVCAIVINARALLPTLPHSQPCSALRATRPATSMHTFTCVRCSWMDTGSGCPCMELQVGNSDGAPGQG